MLGIAAAAMVGTLPGRTQGLGLITEPLLAELDIDRLFGDVSNFRGHYRLRGHGCGAHLASSTMASSGRCAATADGTVTIALYGTIWMVLALFVLAEAGTHLARHRPAAWAWRASILGAVLAAVHVVLALGVRYGWNHDRAVSGTARQAAALYGFEWRGSI